MYLPGYTGDDQDRDRRSTPTTSWERVIIFALLLGAIIVMTWLLK
jgi:hypothetical protein